MNADVIERLVALGEEKAGLVIEKPAAEPEHVYLVKRPDGNYDRIEAAPEPRDHTVLAIGDFVSYVLTWNATLEEGACAPVVWYSREKIVAVLDDETRRDEVTLPLALSPQVGLIQMLESKAPQYDQRQFVHLLRVALKGCLTQHPTLLDVVRSVKFRIDQGGDARIEHGKASIGKSLSSELTGAGAIPEEVSLYVPAFVGVLPTHVCVRCALVVNEMEQKFQLLPYPGEIEAAIRAAEARLGEELQTGFEGCKDVCCFYGRP